MLNDKKVRSIDGVTNYNWENIKDDIKNYHVAGEFIQENHHVSWEVKAKFTKLKED